MEFDFDLAFTKLSGTVSNNELRSYAIWCCRQVQNLMTIGTVHVQALDLAEKVLVGDANPEGLQPLLEGLDILSKSINGKDLHSKAAKYATIAVNKALSGLPVVGPQSAAYFAAVAVAWEKLDPSEKILTCWPKPDPEMRLAQMIELQKRFPCQLL